MLDTRVTIRIIKKLLPIRDCVSSCKRITRRRRTYGINSLSSDRLCNHTKDRQQMVSIVRKRMDDKTNPWRHRDKRECVIMKAKESQEADDLERETVSGKRE